MSCSLQIDHDPIQAALQAAEFEYPGIRAHIYFDPAIDAEKINGYTSFCTCSTPEPKVGISLYVLAVDLPEVLCHELAHVAAGKEAGHNAEWAAAFRRIFRRWSMLQGDGSEPTPETWEALEENLRDDMCMVAADPHGFAGGAGGGGR